MIGENQPEQRMGDPDRLSEAELEEDGAQQADQDEILLNAQSLEIDSRSLKAPISLIKVLLLSVLAATFFISIFLNISNFAVPKSPDGQSTNGIYLILVVLSLVVTAISIGVSFWMYYVRAIYLKDGPALVPEKWGIILAQLTEVTAEANLHTNASLNSVIKSSSLQFKKSESLLESFLTLQDAISSRDREIERLKKGHDTKVFKRFLMRFIRVSRALREIYDESIGTSQEKDYKYLLRLIEDALEECGVELYSPTLGKDYREVGPEIADDPKIIGTLDPQKDYVIAAVESPGFVIEGEGDLQVIVPAKVAIYRMEKNSQGEN